ncbi:MAG: APC family permease [Pseudomonadota bacterium]|nr:APC family permease [Pseudomonadota bacterium]
MSQKKTLNTWSLVMINIIAIDNLRTLSFSAKFGTSLIAFYLIAGICFFLPSALVTAELASRYPIKGGIYIWIEKAFGKPIAFFITLIQWIYNVVWFPTIMIFIWSILTYTVNIPILKTPFGTFIGVLSLFWGCTYANIFGMSISSRVSTAGAIFGTLLPMALLTIGGLSSLYFHNGTEALLTNQPVHADVFPYFVELIFGLIGIEMSAMHADEVKNPERAFPKAILISCIIIFVSLMIASLSVSILIPSKDLNIITGTLQAVAFIAQTYHIYWLTGLFGALILLGSLSTVAAWIIGPVKGLWAAANHGLISPVFAKTNDSGVPINLLLLQACIYSIFVFLILYFPVNTSFVLLSALTTQMALITYIVLFMAAIKLMKSRPKQGDYFKVPLLKLTSLLGMITAFFTLGLGFFMPGELGLEHSFQYFVVVSITFVILLLTSILVAQRSQN